MLSETLRFASQNGIAGITERDGQIIEIFKDPQTVGMIRDLFSSASAMYRRLGILVKRKLLFVDDLRESACGRPLGVYSSWPLIKGRAKHELLLSVCLGALGIDALRGPFVGPQKPDAERGRACFEMDCDTEGWRPQVRERMSTYVDTDKVVVFITTRKNPSKIFEYCDFLADGLLACSVDEAVKGRATDCDGNLVALRDVFQKLLTGAHAKYLKPLGNRQKGA